MQGAWKLFGLNLLKLYLLFRKPPTHPSHLASFIFSGTLVDDTQVTMITAGIELISSAARKRDWAQQQNQMDYTQHKKKSYGIRMHTKCILYDHMIVIEEIESSRKKAVGVKKDLV